MILGRYHGFNVFPKIHALETDSLSLCYWYLEDECLGDVWVEMKS